jgi:hypothetical protein
LGVGAGGHEEEPAEQQNKGEELRHR